MRDGWDEGDNYFRRHGQANREASLRPTPLLGSLPNPYFMSGTIEGDRANEERPEEIERRRRKKRSDGNRDRLEENRDSLAWLLADSSNRSDSNQADAGDRALTWWRLEGRRRG